MTESWTQSVYSDMVSEIGYDAEAGAMLVRWKRSSRKSAYLGVPEDVAMQCANAASVGQFINSEIKPNYQHRYV